MPIIANTTSSNTFSAIRAQLNSVTKRINQFAINESTLYANTINANVSLRISGTDVRATFAQNTYVKSVLANTNSRINLLNTNLTGTNTAIRALVSDRLQVANAASIYQTKAVERAALANTNTWNTSQDSRITLVNTNLTATNTAIRGLFSSYLTTSSASSTYQTQAGMSSYLTTSTASSTYAPLASPSFTGTVSSRKVNLTCSGSGWDDGLNIYSSAGTNRWNFLTDSGAGNAMRIAYNNTEAININTGVYTSFAGSARAPIFYDSDNTGYYDDPSSTSNFNIVGAANRFFTGYDSGVSGSMSCSNWFRSNGSTGWYNGDYGGGIYMSDTSWVRVYNNKLFYCQNYIQSDSSIRGPIFYDSEDTTYYVNPNSSSKLISLGIGGGTSNPTSLYIKSYSGVSDGTTQIHKYYGTSASPSESLDWPTPILALRTFQDYDRDTFLSFGLSNDAIYKTDDTVWNFRLRGITNRTTSDGNTHLDIGGPGVLYFRNSYTEQVGGSLRAPIFYDSNDTGYYCDPNSYSSMNQLRLWGNEFWIRGESPTIHFQDTDQYSAALHNNSNLFYVLRGGVDDTSWSTVGSGWWPCYWNLTNNDCTMGGNISAAYNIIAYASDRRLKENIAEIPNALDKIKQIRGVTFDWNDEAEVLGFTPETKYNDLGVIAQEIQAVLPQAVKPAPFDQWFPDPSRDYEQEYLDQMMGTSRSGENYLTVQLDKIVPLLIEGIKEQQNQIEELRNELQALRGTK